nr:lasso peptide biosynthesis B2 protein [Gymnodinialimonas phycosphaerae]
MGIVAVALRKVRSATTFSAFELILIAPVFMALGVARLAILILPFRLYARVLGQPAGLDVETAPVSDSAMARARAIGKVVRRTARITPWQSVCLGQAMVAALLLRLAGVPYCGYFGVAAARDGAETDPLSAHAWVRVGHWNATGGQDVRRYAVVMVFKHSPRHGG